MNRTPKEAIRFELECSKITQLINVEVLEGLLPTSTDENVLQQIRDELKKSEDIVKLMDKKISILEGLKYAQGKESQKTA